MFAFFFVVDTCAHKSVFLGTCKTFQGVRSCPTQACNVRWVSGASVSGTLVDQFPGGDRGAMAGDQAERWQNGQSEICHPGGHNQSRQAKGGGGGGGLRVAL